MAPATLLPIRTAGSALKVLNEYLDRAVQLESLAKGEPDCSFRTQLLTQASAYRKLAAKRASDLGLPAPSPPEHLARRS
jgi:hypothetical protein